MGSYDVVENENTLISIYVEKKQKNNDAWLSENLYA